MTIEKFDFPLPAEEEIETIKEIAKFCPEHLDGRDIWVLQKFIESGFE